MDQSKSSRIHRQNKKYSTKTKKSHKDYMKTINFTKNQKYKDLYKNREEKQKNNDYLR